MILFLLVMWAAAIWCAYAQAHIWISYDFEHEWKGLLAGFLNTLFTMGGAYLITRDWLS